jgi:hypothetical protein
VRSAAWAAALDKRRAALEAEMRALDARFAGLRETARGAETLRPTAEARAAADLYLREMEGRASAAGRERAAAARRALEEARRGPAARTPGRPRKGAIRA